MKFNPDDGLIKNLDKLTLNHKIPIECEMCHREFVIEVSFKDFQEWTNDYLIQDAMPYLSPAESELLISATCPKCFDSMTKGLK